MAENRVFEKSMRNTRGTYKPLQRESLQTEVELT